MTTSSSLAVDPARERLRRAMRQARRRDARLAAMILVAEPERLSDLTVGDFLLKIHYVSREQVANWLARAGVSPWRPGKRLSYRERHILAGQLATYAATTSEANA